MVFTSRQPIRNKETAMKVLHDITMFFNCKLTEIPSYFLRKENKSLAINSLKQCLTKAFNNNYVYTPYLRHKCMKEAIAKCNFGPRLIKTIRLSMGVASTLLKRLPNLKIVHLLRDPRGIVYSRLRQNFFYDNTTSKVAVANSLCSQLLRDIERSQELRKQYPGQVKIFHYERMAKHPEQESKNLFQFLGIIPPSSFRNWLLTNTYGGVSSGGYFGITRSNSTETANRWRGRLPIEVVELIDTACPKVYEYMGLKKFS